MVSVVCQGVPVVSMGSLWLVWFVHMMMEQGMAVFCSCVVLTTTANRDVGCVDARASIAVGCKSKF